MVIDGCEGYMIEICDITSGITPKEMNQHALLYLSGQITEEQFRSKVKVLLRRCAPHQSKNVASKYSNTIICKAVAKSIMNFQFNFIDLNKWKQMMTLMYDCFDNKWRPVKQAPLKCMNPFETFSFNVKEFQTLLASAYKEHKNIEYNDNINYVSMDTLGLNGMND